MNTSSLSNRGGQAWLPLLAVAVIVGLAIGWWFMTPPPALPPDQGQVIVEEFLQQIRQGKTDQAWQSTATDFKSYLGKEAFRAYVNKYPVLKQTLQFQSHDPLATTLRPEYVYQPKPGTTKTGSSAASRIVKVRLAEEAKVWKIESLAIQ